MVVVVVADEEDRHCHHQMKLAVACKLMRLVDSFDTILWREV